MKSALIWMKHNPIAVVAALLSVCSLVGLFVVYLQGSSFVEEMEKRNSAVQRIKTLKTTRVKIPSPDLDNPVEHRDITINEAAIESLKEVYHKMGIEYTNIFALAVNQNRKGHDPLLDGLFPSFERRVDKVYDAQVQYLNAFEAMLLEYSPTDIYPRLDAGGSVDLAQVTAEVNLAQKNFMLRLGLPDDAVNLLTAEQQQQLVSERRGAAIRVMTQHAERHHIYVDDPTMPGTVFQIGEWSNSAFKPDISVIWQGQLELWVQQDIVQAISSANQVWSPTANVLSNPVKKLLNMSVTPGYVGIDTTGALTTAGRLTPGEKRRDSVRLPNGFRMTPTGRRSNNIYDVVHARVSLIVDYRQISKVFEAFGKTNFMTVLKADLTDVDEYEALHNGFMYGDSDCVQLDMIIESLWLRDWTKRLMPQAIKERLSIETKDASGR
ncbi:MAG: hypothetical protein ACF8OB_11165 [Phycisphaeraceae bacterium JB051]